MRLTLKPFGPVDPEVLEHLRKELRPFDEVVVASEGPLPEAALDARRHQFRALTLLEALRDEPGDRVLGITAADLYEPNMNFIFGLANLHDRFGVISLARLADGSQPKLLERAVKEAAHELGHTLGLAHDDRNPSCVMHFSLSLADTDRKGRDFCPRCAEAASFTLKRLRRRR